MGPLEGLWGSNVWDHWRACGGLMCGTIGGFVHVKRQRVEYP